MARLIVNAGTPQAQEFILKPGLNTLGRREDNDVTIPDPSVSSAHCQLIVADGTVHLRDLGSTNGTFVNGAPFTEVDLKAGQEVRLGGVPLVFEGNGEQPSTPGTVSTVPPTPVAFAVPTAGRLRIGTTHQPVTVVSASEPEALIEEATPVAPFAPPNAKCKYHPRSLARWICTGCRKTYCDLCVSTRGSGNQKVCQSCGGMAAPLEVQIEVPEEKSFFRELPRAFVYPFRGMGILILIVATILFAALGFLGRGIMGLLIQIVAIGYLYSYVQNIIHSTAAGEDKLPDLPAMDDVFSGCFRLIGTVLMAFGPAMVLAYLAIAQEQPTAGIALIPAIIFGCVYLPMAFLAVAMKDNVMASNPLVVVPSILRVPLEYLVTAILVVGMFGVRFLGDRISGEMAVQAFETRSMSEMLMLFCLRALWAFLSVYLLTVTMRILGLLYLTKRDRLGW